MNIEINSENSFLGKDIRNWCFNSDSVEAYEIRENYYSDNVKYKPNDRVYYFVEYVTTAESYRACGSLNMAGGRLTRDTEKSPRRI